jgi:hypothetical protein
MGKYQNYSYFLLVQEPEAGGKVERYWIADKGDNREWSKWGDLIALATLKINLK